jgi:hypothetical protein
MGHRANFVLIEGAQAQAFRDQWAALACMLSLEEGARRLKKQVPEIYERTDGLMDWAFAEGGFLIDYDEKVCIAFGYVDVDMDDIPEEHQEIMRPLLDAFHAGWAEYVHFIEKGWRGFTMILDGRGVDAFAQHLEKRKITSIKTATPSHPKSVAKDQPEVVVVPEVAKKATGAGKSKTTTASVKKASRKRSAAKASRSTNVKE